MPTTPQNHGSALYMSGLQRGYALEVSPGTNIPGHPLAEQDSKTLKGGAPHANHSKKRAPKYPLIRALANRFLKRTMADISKVVLGILWMIKVLKGLKWHPLNPTTAGTQRPIKRACTAYQFLVNHPPWYAIRPSIDLRRRSPIPTAAKKRASNCFAHESQISRIPTAVGSLTMFLCVFLLGLILAFASAEMSMAFVLVSAGAEWGGKRLCRHRGNELCA